MGSLFSDIANMLGHTVESLAQDVGADAAMLENVVSELVSNSIEVFSAAANLGLSPIIFLRSIVDLMRGDPHELLLQRLTGPVKVMDEPLHQLSQQWTQMVNLHEGTAQTLNAHVNKLFQGNESDSYSGPAATALWETHQRHQQYFTMLVDHAQTQQIRHVTLGGQVSAYTSQMRGTVYNYSTPMAAFGVLSLDTVVAASPPAISDPPSGIQQLEQGTEDTLTTLEQDETEQVPGPENPIWDILAVFIIAVVIFIGILKIIEWFQSVFANHQNQQKNTTTPKPTPVPTPTPTPLPTPGSLTPAQQQEVKDILADATKEGLVVDQSDVEALVRAGYDRTTILAMLRAGSLQGSIGKTYTTSSGYVYTAHVMSHIAIPPTVLEDQTTKNNKAGGKGIATSFPDAATAQAAVNFAIANDTALQLFIRAAVPNSSLQKTICDSSRDFGYGFQRNVLPSGVVAPPTPLPHLHCVTVWFAVDASGNVFVVDAYPALS